VLPPGKTAKNRDRQFVVNDYHDHSQDEDDEVFDRGCYSPSSTLFPLKLHAVLEEVENDGLDHIISWAPHGRCFTPKVSHGHITTHVSASLTLSRLSPHTFMYFRQ
jgi:hypothetical protein